VDSVARTPVFLMSFLQGQELIQGDKTILRGEI